LTEATIVVVVVVVVFLGKSRVVVWFMPELRGLWSAVIAGRSDDGASSLCLTSNRVSRRRRCAAPPATAALMDRKQVPVVTAAICHGALTCHSNRLLC